MRWKNGIVSSTLALSLLVLPTASASAMVAKEDVDTLIQVYTQLADGHYTHPNQDKLLQAAIEGMLNEINDPFTSYMSPEEYQGFVGAIEQSFAGIGVAFTAAGNEGALIVNEVYKGTPAEKAGLQKGDRVLAVDGVAVTADNASDLPAKIRGQEGTTVVLTVKQGTEEPKQVTITRANIELPLTHSEDLGDGIGYIQLMSFGDRSADEFSTALTDLQKKNIQSLVIDLRGNGGGHVLPALQIADTFLGKGTILRTHDQEGTVQDVEADSEVNNLPLVVLIDGNSASASEMLAGALQKNGRAKLVGTQSYGKGTMQAPQELPNGGYLKLSVDRWELADGTSPDKVGLTPDVRITSSNPVSALNAAMQLLKPTRTQELSFSRTDATAKLNGHEMANVPQPFVEGTAYLPLRFTAESLGAQVDWVAAESAVKFRLAGHAVAVSLHTGEVKIDGQPSRYSHAVRTMDGATYISADTLGEIVGQSVEVNEQEVRVRLK
ncbi:MAG: S41 family peptidase [Tumebacillaceae bacterium]